MPPGACAGMGMEPKTESTTLKVLPGAVQVFLPIRKQGLQYPAVLFQDTVDLPNDMVILAMKPVMVPVSASIIAETLIRPTSYRVAAVLAGSFFTHPQIYPRAYPCSKCFSTGISSFKRQKTDTPPCQIPFLFRKPARHIYSTQKNNEMNEASNKVVLIGNLGRDPEIKTYGDNKKLAKMSIAVNETYRNNNGDTTAQTHWHHVVAWGKLAEVAEQNFFKGNRVSVEGKLTSRTYLGKDGIKRYATEIVASQLGLAGQKD
jgi:single-strand DNA-binding protein